MWPFSKRSKNSIQVFEICKKKKNNAELSHSRCCSEGFALIGACTKQGTQPSELMKLLSSFKDFMIKLSTI